MSRISSAASNTALINILQRTQQRLFDSQMQVTSEKVSQTYLGIAQQSQRLINIENLQMITERYLSNNTTAETRLNATSIAVESVRDTIKNFDSILTLFGQKGSTDEQQIKDMQTWAFTALQNMESFLNTQIDGRYLFSGSRTNKQPVNFNLSTLANFQALFDGARVTVATTREAQLADFSYTNDRNNENALFINDSNFLTFRRDDDGNSATSGDSSITATSALFTNVAVGTTINVTGTASNNGTYTVKSVSSDSTKLVLQTEMLTDETVGAGASFTLADKTVLTSTATGSVTFNRAGDTITATNSGAFLAASVGEIFTVANTTQNDGVYTIKSVSANGTVVTVESVKLTDEGLGSGTNFFDYSVGSKMVFNQSAGTIQAQTFASAALTGAFSGLQVGDSITVAGSTVPFTLLTQIRFTDNGAGNNDTIQIVESDGTTPVTGAFADVNPGDTVTLAGSAADDGAYVVNSVSADGSTITIDAGIASGASSVDANSTALSGGTFTNFTTRTHLQFTDNGATDRITLQDDTNAAIAAGLDSLSVGMTVTITGANTAANDGTFLITAVDTAGGYIDVVAVGGGDPGLVTEASIGGTTIAGGGNDATYTISALSTDNSTLTVNGSPALFADQTDTDGTTVSAAGFSITTGTKLFFDSTNEQISILQKSSGSTVTNVFNNLIAGMTINASGAVTNNGAFTISSIAGGVITVAEDITVAESASDGGSLNVYAANGTVSATPYYNGDNTAFTHRLDRNRSFEWDLNAIDPAFEKSIRAMFIIAQGAFNTEGGLDQNSYRLREVKFLLQDALYSGTEGTPPYGKELLGNMEDVRLNVGSRLVLINQINERHEQFSNFLATRVSEVEDVDLLEAVTALLDDSRALEASFQALARVRRLTLSAFL